MSLSRVVRKEKVCSIGKYSRNPVLNSFNLISCPMRIKWIRCKIWEQKHNFPLWLRPKKGTKANTVGMMTALPPASSFSKTNSSKTPWWFIHVRARIFQTGFSTYNSSLCRYFLSHCSGKCDPPLLLKCQSVKEELSMALWSFPRAQEAFTEVRITEWRSFSWARFDRDGLSIQIVKISSITGTLSTGRLRHQNWKY